MTSDQWCPSLWRRRSIRPCCRRGTSQPAELYGRRFFTACRWCGGSCRGRFGRRSDHPRVADHRQRRPFNFCPSAAWISLVPAGPLSPARDGATGVPLPMASGHDTRNPRLRPVHQAWRGESQTVRSESSSRNNEDRRCSDFAIGHVGYLQPGGPSRLGRNCGRSPRSRQCSMATRGRQNGRRSRAQCCA
jgi:hypothetical protein